MKLKLRQTDFSPRSFRAWLDDQEITSGLTGVTVEFAVDDLTVATLKVAVDDLDVDAETLAVLEAHVEARQAA